MSATRKASSTVKANTDTQSSVRQAGTTPAALSQPRVGLSPTMLLKPAGTRPEPAVSVPSENAASPRATTEAEPELDPPLMYSGRNALATAPCGERVPTGRWRTGPGWSCRSGWRRRRRRRTTPASSSGV